MIFQKVCSILKTVIVMKSKNICKFINPSAPEPPFVRTFVLETDLETMKRGFDLSVDRAVLVTSGEVCFTAGERRLELSAGNLFFGFKDEKIAVEPNGKCEYIYIDFRGERSEELFKRFGISAANRCFKGFDGLIPLWSESLCRAGEQSVDLAGESMLLYAFSRLSAEPSEQNCIVSQMIELTEEHFTDPELSLSAIADELGYNGKYLSHVFKEKMNKGYSEYLRTIRIKYAVSLFNHGIDSVKNVALLSGFSDPLYFSTVFRKEIGVTPTEYKNNIGK